MKDELIQFETAKLAKEKGFKEILCCFVYYNGLLQQSRQIFNRDNFELAPSQSLLQRWLREAHNIYISILFKEDEDLHYEVTVKEYRGLYSIESHKEIYNTYEAALEQGLIEGLKLIK